MDATAEKLALFRYGLIAPLVLEPLPRGELTRRAAEIAGRTRLSGPVALTVSGSSALAVTPGLRGRVDELLHAAEIRSYPDFRAWLADGCFPEKACPPPSIPVASR